MKKVISFSLWGTDKKYTLGAIRNIEHARRIYPGWKCRFYISLDVPPSVISVLLSLGGEIFMTEKSDGYSGLYWRFQVAFDPDVDRFLIRDTDSRLNPREAAAVREWEESGKQFHAMRDHQFHTVPIMGGMWGAVKGFMPHFESRLDDWLEGVNPGTAPQGAYHNTDQVFLQEMVWPWVKPNCIVHDDRKTITGKEFPFQVKLPGDLFVGQAFESNEKPINNY